MTSSTPAFPPIRACLFDMDGLLIDSEDIYTECTNIVLKEHGRPELPWSIKAQLQGRPAVDANRLFQDWAKLPMSAEEYGAKLTALQVQKFPNTKPLPGVPELLNGLVKRGTRVALASSSLRAKYEIKTNHLRSLFDLFPESQKVVGDDPRIPRGKGKPAPDIYLLALETVNANLRAEGAKEILPEECLVFEDAVPGVEAGRRAGMRVIWCPHPLLLKEFEGREEDVLAGLGEARAGIEQEAPASAAEGRLFGWPGKKGDGWGELYHTLEGFDIEKYVGKKA